MIFISILLILFGIVSSLFVSFILCSVGFGTFEVFGVSFPACCVLLAGSGGLSAGLSIMFFVVMCVLYVSLRLF